MTRYKTHEGPFPTRLWYEDAEFENITAQALRKHKLYPAKPSPVNIELFVELQFGISYRFEKLRKGVLGAMRFPETGPGGITPEHRAGPPAVRECEPELRDTGTRMRSWPAARGTLHRVVAEISPMPEAWGRGT